METMTATSYSSPPLAQTTSHLRESRNPALSHPKVTRPAQAVQQPALSAPASQESFVSVQSAGGSSVVSNSHPSNSDLSQITTDTDLTSPASVIVSQSTQDAAIRARDGSQMHRDRTPEQLLQTPQLGRASALASPMSIVTSPVATNGAKRTASGHVKNAPSLPNTPYTSTFFERESRRQSISSSTSRAGELAATLKTRLGYAMAKVQHGWEHKSLHEVEQLAAHRARSSRHSMSFVDQQRPRTSGLNNGAIRGSLHDADSRASGDVAVPPPSKRHSGTYAGFLYFSQHSAAPALPAPHGLQPAADIRPASSSRHVGALSPGQPLAYNAAMSPPRTPVSVSSRRPPTIRTETQRIEAERDALQALFQLGSPRTSQAPRSATAFSSQASPLEASFDTPRRVAVVRSQSSSSDSGGGGGGGGDGSSAPPSSSEASEHERIQQSQ